MDDLELSNKLTAWWLGFAPQRQEELLMVPMPPLVWLDESIASEGLERADVDRFLDEKRRNPEISHDAGVNPKPA